MKMMNRKRKGSRSLVNRNAGLALSLRFCRVECIPSIDLQKSSLLILGGLSIFIFNTNCNKTPPAHWDLKPITEKMAIEVERR